MIQLHILKGETKIKLDNILNEILERSLAKGGGAILTYIGYVKTAKNKRKVKEFIIKIIDKEKLTNELKEILKEKQCENLIDIRVYINTGRLKPGYPILYIIASSKTRKELFTIVKELLEKIKNSKNIVKKDIFEDKG